jgi:AcrR family transcriptional regulator
MAETAKKAYHHGDLRHALIEAAIPVLREKGIVGLSLRELATELGVSHGAPYRHFHNKSELLEAVAATGFRKLAAYCTRATHDFPQDPQRQLYEAGWTYIRYVSTHKEVANLMFGGVMSLDHAGPELKQAADQAIEALSAIVENGKQAGLYGNRDTADLVVTSLSTVHGLSMFVSAGMLCSELSEPDALKALSVRVYDILMHGLLDQ